jgi:hypothetical protein
MRLPLKMAVLARGIGDNGGPSIAEWPFPATITEDISTFGSSTETAWAPTPIEWIKSDYAPTAVYNTSTGSPSGTQAFMNYAAGGSNSTGLVTQVSGAPARAKAATGNLLVGGAYESQDDPIPTIITNLGLAIAAAGHSNFVIAPKHNDGATISASGQGTDCHRLRELTRRLGAPNSAYYGMVSDTSLFNRRWSTPRDATDIATKLKDQVQNSWWGGSPPTSHTDTAHMQGDDVGMGYYGGSHARGQYVQAPYYVSRISGMPAFIPHQNRHSTEKATFQTPNGFVCNIATRGSLADHTCDVFYADGSPVGGQWAVAIVGGVLKLYRGPTATKNNNGYTVLKVRLIKNGKASWGFVRVYLIDLTPDGTESAFINSQFLVKENPYGASISGPKYSFALALRARSASSTQKTFRAGQGTGGGGPFMEIKATANQNMGVSMSNTSGATGFNFDQPTAQGFTSARGLQWLFGCFDTATAGAATGGGTGKVRTDSLVSGLSAVSTAGTCNLGTDLRIYLRGNNLFSVIGSFTAAGSRLLDNVDVVGLWEADDYVDWGDTAMLDLVRDPTTRRPLLGTTRGADTPGKVNGVTPRLWMQGPAGNWAAGANLALIDPANGTGFWDATDRVDPDGGAAITTVNT